MRNRLCYTVLVPSALWVALGNSALASPYAVAVHSYDPGSAAGSGYEQPAAALGPPERLTGEGTAWPSVVSPFAAPWLPTEIVKIGAGGHLTLALGRPVTDHPDHPLGIDLIVFGNGAFLDDDWPNGLVGDPATLFGNDPMFIEVSDNGTDFVTLGTFEEGFFPTLGYLDSRPGDTTAGSVLSDFFKPVDPALTLQDFAGLNYDQVLALYDASGGGTPLDLGPSGLSSASYIRISVPAGGAYDVEIDALTVVPEPPAWQFLLVLGPFAFRRRLR